MRTPVFKTYVLITCSFLLLLSCLAVYGAGHPKSSPDLILTEICTRNDTVIYDDNGDYGTDYVELYNAADHDISLAGYGLTDDPRRPFRYVFPEGSRIKAGEAKVFWGKRNIDRRDLYREGYIPREIGFSFSAGETCTLTDPEGFAAASIRIPDVPSDRSYACAKADPEEYRICIPSPGIFQDQLSFPEKEALPLPSEPVFSLPSGFYEEEIRLSLSSGGKDIYYTLDGTMPDASSLKYEGPIRIRDQSGEANRYASISGISIANPFLPAEPVDKAVIVKAVAVDEGGRKSPVAAASYFIGFGRKEGYENMPVISLTADPEDLFSEERGIYVLGDVYRQYLDRYETLPGHDYSHETNYSREGRGWERPAKLEFFNEERECLLSQRIGIRIHGGWSVGLAQKSFNLYAREEYDGSSSFRYPFFGQEDDKLMLRTGGRRDIFATEFRDQLPQYLIPDREVGIQKGFPCAVFLNGEYWGLYHLQEKVSEGYVENHYGIPETDSVILKVGTAGDSVINGTWRDLKLYRDFVAEASRLDLSEDANYRYVSSVMDIQSYIDYMCANIYIANCDYLDNNYAVWRASPGGGEGYRDGRWRFLTFDTDDSAGMVRSLTGYDTDSFTGGHWNGISPLSDPLFSSLLKNQGFREEFIASFTEMAERNYDYTRVHAVIGELSGLYAKQSVMTARRFRGDYRIPDYDSPKTPEAYGTMENYLYEVRVLDDFYRKRKDHILEFLKRDL